MQRHARKECSFFVFFFFFLKYILIKHKIPINLLAKDSDCINYFQQKNSKWLIIPSKRALNNKYAPNILLERNATFKFYVILKITKSTRKKEIPRLGLRFINWVFLKTSGCKTRHQIFFSFLSPDFLGNRTLIFLFLYLDSTNLVTCAITEATQAMTNLIPGSSLIL